MLFLSQHYQRPSVFFTSHSFSSSGSPFPDFFMVISTSQNLAWKLDLYIIYSLNFSWVLFCSWKCFYCSHSPCGCPLLFYWTGKKQVREDSTNKLHYIQKCQEISFKSYYQRYFPVWPKAILLIPALEPGASQWNIYRKMYVQSAF